MKIVGLMSGTSVDGIDAALVEIEGEPPALRWKLLQFACMPWEVELRKEILDLCRPTAPLRQVTALNTLIGEYFAAAARQVADTAGIPLEEVDAIASHGQTLWHQPTAHRLGSYEARGTCQIGEPAVIAARTGCKVVADFRAADMALGGQGAPLVPFVDYALFSSPVENRAMLNLGGIANVTYLPAGSGLNDLLAFDTGPANMLIDRVTRMVTEGAQEFDAEGALAAQGTPNETLLTELLAMPYFQEPPPKSTGREMFGQEFAVRIVMRAKQMGLSPCDVIATATAFTVRSIEKAFRDWLLPRGAVQTVILGGGGVHNRTLFGMLGECLAPARITTHMEFGIPDDAKEAMAFAILGYETLHNRPSNVPAATGASGPAILGKIVLPPPTAVST